MKKLIVIILLSISSLFGFENLTNDVFDEKVKNKKVILDFYATWCPPCKEISKNLNTLKDDLPKDVVVYKIDVDEEPELAQRFGVQGLPTIVYLKDSKKVYQDLGLKSVMEFKIDIDRFFK